MTQIEPIEKPEIKTIVDYIKLDTIQESAERTLGDGGRQFLTSILSLANSNPAIMACEPRSVYTACLTAAALNLPINQNLGFAYIIPYKNKNTRTTEAQFQMGYKGFIQLAQRSGEFKGIGANTVHEGQLIEFDNFTGEPVFDFNVEHNNQVIGYMAYFQLKNGFRKAAYMPTDKVKKHATKYSQSFKSGYGVWKDDFDGMAKKTVLKLLLSKFAPMSIDLARAIEADQKVADEYLDNKITFEVEGAAIEGEPIEDIKIDELTSLDEYSDEPFTDEPA